MSESEKKGKKKKPSHLGARMLIILYGMGIVAIGLQPIQKEYGSIFKFLRQKSVVLAKNVKSSKFWEKLGDRPKIEIQSADAGLNGRSRKKQADLDRLSETDRESLDNLLNNIK